MRNPLNKRLLRDLKGDAGKYAVIFILLVLSIGFVSGFLVAGSSMIKAYNDSFEKYNIEDGNFRTAQPLSDTQKSHLEKKGIEIFPNYYVEKEYDNGTTLRIYSDRKAIDRVCVMKGRLPENVGEIAIDRMYADNNDLSVGDVLSCPKDEEKYTITALVALSDYSALFYSNNDMMFDASAFGVATVCDEQFGKFNGADYFYNYSWKYDIKPADEDEEKEVSDELSRAISDITDLESFVPGYLNQSITFTGEDIVGDKAMMEVLLYIIIVIVAFVFTITISNTIHKESNVIGTLRALGYTINEMVLHYMSMPLIVTLISALVGNVLGYTVLKNVCVDMYYGSYSLPTYVTIWNGEAFVRTTLIPVVIMIAVTFLILKSKLSLSPLMLIRRDLSGKKKTKAVRLSKKIGFFKRFSIRIFIQNKSSYMTLFIGVVFANVLLFFGMMLPPLLIHYQAVVIDTMLAKYTYLLQIPAGAVDGEDMLSAAFSYTILQKDINTNNSDAEKFSACSLKTTGMGGERVEEVTLYGISDNSRYINADFDEKTVLVSSAYADKYGLEKGDVITLKEPYEDTYYGFKVTGVYDYDGAVAVFMSRSHLNKVLGYDEEFFGGFFSDSQITDIKGKYIGTVVDEESLTRVSRQLMISMGSLMHMVDGFSIILFVVLIYLLSKLIIERNARNISMVKILGYSKREIARLYIIPTTIMVVVSLLVSYPLITFVMVRVFRIMLKKMMSGWMIIWLDPKVYGIMFMLGILSYSLVAAAEYFRIGKIPMGEALKDIE